MYVGLRLSQETKIMNICMPISEDGEPQRQSQAEPISK